MIIRKSTKEDYDNIIKLINSMDEIDQKFLALKSKINYIKEVIRKGNHCYVAEYKGEIVGFLRESGRPNGFSIIEELMVKNNMRNKGIGRKIITYYHEYYNKNLAKTNSKNLAMIHLLKNMGYKSDNPNKIRIIDWYRY